MSGYLPGTRALPGENAGARAQVEARRKLPLGDLERERGGAAACEDPRAVGAAGRRRLERLDGDLQPRLNDDRHRDCARVAQGVGDRDPERMTTRDLRLAGKRAVSERATPRGRAPSLTAHLYGPRPPTTRMVVVNGEPTTAGATDGAVTRRGSVTVIRNTRRLTRGPSATFTVNVNSPARVGEPVIAPFGASGQPGR